MVVAAAALGIAAGVAINLLHHRDRPSPGASLPRLLGQATWPAGARPAPDFSLADQDGRRTTLASLRGRAVMLTFLDSRCHRPCAREVRPLAVALRLLPRSARPVVVVVSADPWGDTRGSARAAARRWGLTAGSSWHWLLGSRSELAPVWRSYRIAVRRTRGGVAHTPATYLIDRRGFERAGLLYPFPPSWPAGDLRALAQES